MESKLVKYENISEAISAVNALIWVAKKHGMDVAGAKVRQHLYPGDVYDAYEAIGRNPTMADELNNDACGPLVAVFLHRCPDADPDTWRAYVENAFESQYAAGFSAGFRLNVPAELGNHQAIFLRGVYEGVMAHAAVF